jgi:phage tail-like protein
VTVRSTLGQSRYKGQPTEPTRLADPPYAGVFTLKIGDWTMGRFMEVSGLSVTVEVEDLVEGGHNGGVHRLVGRTKWPNLVLKRGITQDDALFAWLGRTSVDGFAMGAEVRDARADRALGSLDGSISVCGTTGEPLRTWSFVKAFPVRWSGPKLAASSNELASEELEICHMGFTPTTFPPKTSGGLQ